MLDSSVSRNPARVPSLGSMQFHKPSKSSGVRCIADSHGRRIPIAIRMDPAQPPRLARKCASWSTPFTTYILANTSYR